MHLREVIQTFQGADRNSYCMCSAMCSCSLLSSIYGVYTAGADSIRLLYLDRCRRRSLQTAPSLAWCATSVSPSRRPTKNELLALNSWRRHGLGSPLAFRDAIIWHRSLSGSCWVPAAQTGSIENNWSPLVHYVHVARHSPTTAPLPKPFWSRSRVIAVGHER